jgi:hypothetical protein
MRNKDKHLNVDFIGGKDPMTKEEELLVSAFIKKLKLLAIKKTKVPKTNN